MTIYEALKQDHRKIEKLLDRLVRASESDRENWKDLVDEIRDALIPHSRAEEAVFYNAIRELDKNNGVVASSYLEHAVAEADLRTLQGMKLMDINWTTLAKKLRRDILDHVKNEEEVVFSLAKETFTTEEATMIAKAFKELKPTIQEQSFVGTSIDLISNLMPRRLVTSFKKNFYSRTKRSA